ncbi:reverse transcriptase domain-containing protein [Tanacetum coccineum]
MAGGDEDKTSFFTRKGVFCYRKMPFSLKNAGASYQRLVKKVFNNQIGRNLEAYVDDMVIKSVSDEDMLLDIQETFDRLRSINMKLNPKKCSFRVEEGPFLGHLIAKKGIKANPFKLNYPELEKLILALVHAARRLRRYFQAHPIRVPTDKPFKQILARPEKSGRIAKWAIELREHDIEFKGRNSVKGQILADFLAEIPSIEDKDTKTKNPGATNKTPTLENIWKLYTEEALSSDGSGARLMFSGLEGKGFTYALRFEFETTNNEAEYEALLASLQIAIDMEIKDLAIFVDSQFVENQVKGLFEARQLVIRQYLENFFLFMR